MATSVPAAAEAAAPGVPVLPDDARWATPDEEALYERLNGTWPGGLPAPDDEEYEDPKQVAREADDYQAISGESRRGDHGGGIR